METILQQLRGRTNRQVLGGFGLPVTRNQEFLKVVSRYTVRTLLWFQLEQAISSPTALLLSWTSDTLAVHVLRLLDVLIVALKTQRLRSYFFPSCNVMLHLVSGGQHHPEEDYLSDGEILEGFLNCLYEDSTAVVVPPDDDDVDTKRCRISERLELAIIRNWGRVLSNFAPPATTRSRRLGFGTGSSNPVTYTTAGYMQYAPRQLDYIAQLFREMLRVRQLTLQNQNSPPWFQVPLKTSAVDLQQENPVEDLIYLLSAIFEQAKELGLGDMGSNPVEAYTTLSVRSGRWTASEKSVRRNLGTKGDSYSKLKHNFDASAILLIDSVRRDVDTSNADLSDDLVLVRHVLKWLYRGLQVYRRHMAPLLRPYLNRLFSASHENCWHIEEWRRRQEDQGDEMRALGAFCHLVTASEVSATETLLDAVTKGWTWAERMLDMTEYLVDISEQPEIGLQLVFTPAEGKVIRQCISLPSRDELLLQLPESRYSTCSSSKSTYSRYTGTLRMKKVSSYRGASVTLPSLLAQLPNNCVPQGLGNSASAERIGRQLPHCRLRDASPLTLLLDARRRYGDQRGVGDIVQALISLQKFSILQEVSALLPDDERIQMLDAIQKLSKETRRAAAARRSRTSSLCPNNDATATSRTLRNTKKKSQNSDPKLPQIYRPKEEFHPHASNVTKQSEEERSALALKQQENIAQREKELTKELDKMKVDSTLLGTCRALRSQCAAARHSFLGGVSAYNGSLSLDPAPALPLIRETALTANFRSFSSSSYEGIHNSNVALLQLTEDKALRLARPSNALIRSTVHGDVIAGKAVSRKRDIVTKL